MATKTQSLVHSITVDFTEITEFLHSLAYSRFTQDRSLDAKVTQINPLIKSSPGKGKTTLVRNFAQEMHKLFNSNTPEGKALRANLKDRLVATGRDPEKAEIVVSFLSYRLSTLDKIAMSGIPVKVEEVVFRLDSDTPDKEVEKAAYMQYATKRDLPYAYDITSGDADIYIVLLDEVGQCTPQVMPAIASFMDLQVGDKMLDGSRLFTILATNSVADFAGSNPIPTHVLGRGVIYSLETSVPEWISYSQMENHHPFITGYIRESPDSLSTLPTKDHTTKISAFSTPRSWDNFAMLFNLIPEIRDGIELSTNLDAQKNLLRKAKIQATGTIGQLEAERFCNYLLQIISCLDFPQIYARQGASWLQTKEKIVQKAEGGGTAAEFNSVRLLNSATYSINYQLSALLKSPFSSLLKHYKNHQAGTFLSNNTALSLIPTSVNVNGKNISTFSKEGLLYYTDPISQKVVLYDTLYSQELTAIAKSWFEEDLPFIPYIEWLDQTLNESKGSNSVDLSSVKNFITATPYAKAYFEEHYALHSKGIQSNLRTYFEYALALVLNSNAPELHRTRAQACLTFVKKLNSSTTKTAAGITALLTQ